MKLKSIFVGVILLVGLQALHVRFMMHAFTAQDRILGERLRAAVTHVIELAHRNQDDLIVAQLLQSLARSPGIVSARLMDSRKLELQLSDRLRRQFVKKAIWLGTAVGILLFLILFVHVRWWERKAIQWDLQLVELGALLQTEQSRLRQSQETVQTLLARETAGLQKAAWNIPTPLIVLDPQQRLCAVSPPALAMLEAKEPTTIIGRSWNEVPGLLSCGQALEQSISHPDQEVEWVVPNAEIKLKLKTDTACFGSTWIFL